jgi:hypothetical protein
LAAALGGCLSVSPAASGVVDAASICAPSDAKAVSIQEILREPERFVGRCVSVVGVFDGDDIFSTFEDAVAGSRAPYEQKAKTAIGAFISFDAFDKGAFWSGLFTGRVETCSEAYEKLPEPAKVTLDRWIIGCQHYQSIHLTDLSYENLRQR